MVAALLSFLAGLVGLVAGGHLVVDGSSRLGARLGLTPVVIGLTIVAAGTSAPELAVVFQAVAADDTALAVGSIIGSNIANVLLVLGLVATFGTIRVASRVVRIDIPIMIAASAALLVFSLDGVLGRLDGILLFVALVAFVVWTIRASRGESNLDGVGRDGGDCDGRQSHLIVDIVKLAVGIAMLAIAARYVVDGAEGIASGLGVPELIVGLTIVALGTSAPEIITTLIAALKGRRDLAVGNAVGSNIFNILLVLGSSSALASGGIRISSDALKLDLPILLAAAVACLPMVFWDHRLDRWEGGVFVGYYVAYIIFLVLDGTGHRASDPFAFVLLAFVTPLAVLTAGVAIRRQRSHSKGSQKELDKKMIDIKRK